MIVDEGVLLRDKTSLFEKTYILYSSDLQLLFRFYGAIGTPKMNRGACHYAKDSGKFGRNSNGKVRFGFFRPEYSGSPLEVVHLFRSQYSDPKFAVSFHLHVCQIVLFCFSGSALRG